MKLPLLASLLAGLSLAGLQAADPGRMVSAARSKPSDPWKDYPTRLVSDLTGYYSTVDALTQYGGLESERRRATGYFRTELIGDRWWLIDPEGGRFVHIGVVSVNHPRPIEGLTLPEKQPWAVQAVELLRATGFNGTGAWSSNELLRATPKPVVYTTILNFMSAYGKKRGGTFQKPGHIGYPKDAIFVFDPEFEQFCDDFAKQLLANRNDPWLLGHFSDNELPFYPKTLDNFLSLPASDAGRQAADRWVAAWRSKNPGEEITNEMREAFLGFIADRYLAITTAAIRKYDPNHLCLGPRFHVTKPKALYEAAGRHLDVISVNYYHAWSPDPVLTHNWVKWSGKPYMITEWYAKGMDSGFPNTSGAGWVVKTQADRGHFYQNFTLGLLGSKGCVGWHWFKYRDNDPNDKKADPSNIDSNKGMVNLALRPYVPLVDAMREVNQQPYALIKYFDSKR